MQNMKPIDLLYAHSARISHMLRGVSLYRSKFSNYLYVLRMRAKREFPINAKLKNGTKVLISNNGELRSILFGFTYEKESDIVSLDNGLMLHSAIENGDIIGIFYDNDYDFLPVNEEMVVDIGANIGDSALYFTLKGAKRVIALEPYPQNFETAKKNIILNNLSDRIYLLLSACGDRKGNIIIDGNEKGRHVQAMNSNGGEVVEVRTLESILNEYHLSSAMLKMDCEGCEYDSILNASDQTLRRFPSMQIEYHYGYLNLKKKLTGAGFSVKTSKPKYTYNPDANIANTYTGFLYASLL